MEASKRVRASEVFICLLLVLSALPSYRHANRPGIRVKKRATTEYSAEPRVRISAATRHDWRQISKKEVQPPYASTRMRCATRSCQMLFEYIREGHADFFR